MSWSSKMDLTKFSEEGRNLAKSLMSYFSHILLSKQNQAEALKKQISELENRVKRLEEENNLKNFMTDIDLNDPEVQKAATKIQASFRGHKIRKDIVTTKKEDEAPAKVAEVDDEIADIDLTDPELANAALKIQAGFRGHIARKNVQKTDGLAKDMAALNTKEAEEEEVDIDLTDPEVNKAAIKIQSTFRGHMTRRTQN